jgi:hypothetical protein
MAALRLGLPLEQRHHVGRPRCGSRIEIPSKLRVLRAESVSLASFEEILVSDEAHENQDLPASCAFSAVRASITLTSTERRRARSDRCRCWNSGRRRPRARHCRACLRWTRGEPVECHLIQVPGAVACSAGARGSTTSRRRWCWRNCRQRQHPGRGLGSEFPPAADRWLGACNQMHGSGLRSCRPGGTADCGSAP